MEMNGGNATVEVARIVPNLQTAAVNSQTTAADSPTTKQDKPAAEKQHVLGLGSVEEVEVNGSEVKGNATSPRKLRKVKAKSTGAMEVATAPIAKARGRKRKASEPEDVLSDESADFLGFDVHDAENIGSGFNIIQQLIGICFLNLIVFRSFCFNVLFLFLAKLESSTLPAKQGRKSLAQSNVESKKRTEDKGKLNSASPTKKNSQEPIDANNVNNDAAKMDVSPGKLANSGGNSSPIIGSPKPRGRPPRIDSPNKIAAGTSNPLFREPFKFGWKRELVRADSTAKKTAEVFYYTPAGKKLKSYKEIAPFRE